MQPKSSLIAISSPINGFLKILITIPEIHSFNKVSSGDTSTMSPTLKVSLVFSFFHNNTFLRAKIQFFNDKCQAINDNFLKLSRLLPTLIPIPSRIFE